MLALSARQSAVSVPGSPVHCVATHVATEGATEGATADAAVEAEREEEDEDELPAESQAVQPLLLPFDPQHLPPVHLSDVQASAPEHDSPSFFFWMHSLSTMWNSLEQLAQSPSELHAVQPALLPFHPQQLLALQVPDSQWIFSVH